uniref:Acireductone dioxygenase n=1 Tax=Steinernema glaseri TaxID=37863 RepID=A0A1I7Y472_9BILA
MVNAWYMSDTIVDQRQECHRSPPEFCSLEKLAQLGVVYRHIPTPEKDTGLEQVCAEQGYDYRDEIVINREKLPNYDEKIKSFFEEHLHTDDEARYIAKGCGYFDVRDKQDRWIRILSEEGDLLVLPAGIYHRFTVDENDYINAIRLFKGVPVWTPYNRGKETDQMPIRDEYAQKIANAS